MTFRSQMVMPKRFRFLSVLSSSTRILRWPTRILGMATTTVGEPSIAAGYTRRAYELRDRTTRGREVLHLDYLLQGGHWEYRQSRANLQALDAGLFARVRAACLLGGAVYPVVGQYEKAVEEAKEAIALKPDFPISYAFLMFNYIPLNRLDEAKAAHEQALERKLNNPLYLLALYQIAFLQNDAAGMAQEVASSSGKLEAEDIVLGLEAETAAYSGRLWTARESSRRAVDSDDRIGAKEAAATYIALSSLREALFGNADEARRLTNLAVGRSAGRDVRYAAALALSYAADDKRAQALTDDLGKKFPEDTIVQFNYLPTLRAKLALNERNPSEAIENLRAATTYELGQTTGSTYGWTAMYPVFVRGEAYLAAHRGSEAAAEFQRILDHRGIVINGPIGALAHLGLARAFALQGDTAKASATYQDFLTLWKEADPTSPS